MKKNNEKWKQIELELTPHEKRLYSLSADISLDFLEQVAREHNEAMLDLADKGHLWSEPTDLAQPESPARLPSLPAPVEPHLAISNFVAPPPMPGMDFS